MPSRNRNWRGHRDRLRGKLLARGASALNDYELLETLLFAFIPRRDEKPIAKALLARFGSLSGVLKAESKDLRAIAGVGETAAAYIKTGAEFQARASREEIATRPIISSWASLLSYGRNERQHEGGEQFRVLILERKNQLIIDEIMGTGTVDHEPVYPREIAGRALELQASSVILVHNHPSGDTTREIIDALSPLEITVHDHLIAGTGGVTSLKSAGLI